jgi:sugar lactone lactonase YvrE/mono/diheme cytochrome c family protein
MRARWTGLLFALLCALSACGGGGSSGPAAPVEPESPPPPETPPQLSPPAPEAGRFVTFESGQVRPLALSPNGQRLYAVNTPDNRLEVFDLASGVPRHLESVRVGLEPVAVAARGDDEVWVVNHLSDSVSIVDVAADPPRVVKTLHVGDEPRDIVFAGDGAGRAFITAAHRGQNVPFDPQPHTPGIGRADVWVFDAAATGDALGGEPLTILSLFGDTLRPLAVSPDGSRVYAGVFNSGNRTTIVHADIGGGGLEKPGPQADAAGNPQPRTAMIVRFDGTHWVDDGDPEDDELPRVWDERVNLDLPDYDVFEIDARAKPPAELRRVSGVGTTLFNIAVNPVSGKLYVSNTEARNHVRFEGEGNASTTVRGHFVDARISVVSGQGVAPRHLNKHIQSYDRDLGTEEERALGLATPTGMQVSADGAELYLAAFGSQRVVVYSTVELETDTFRPAAGAQIVLSAGGPSGLVLDEPRHRLYVLTRFDNGISTLDLAARREIDHLTMFNPEPPAVVDGRPFLYDARLSSSRGDSSCAGCHVFGDMDHLSWDLGNPDDVRVASPNTYNSVVPRGLTVPFFHPMKGPMSTQSLRGMRGQGPMHWRGDRTGTSRDADETLEEQAFEDFNVAFTGLLGRESELSEEEMDRFAKFALELSYPPNPHRALDNGLDADQAAGSDFYHDVVSDTIATCNGCHVLDPDAGHFGTDGTMSIEGGGIDEDFKIPHLRNTYQKVGMFGINGNPARGLPHTGDQIRGFGYAHDGAVDTLTTFLSAAVFAFPDAQTRRQTADFVLAFPTDLAPIVGQQVTVDAASAGRVDVRARVDLLLSRARVTEPRPECELVVFGVLDGASFSAVMNDGGSFTPARRDAAALSAEDLFARAAEDGNVLTYTCTPPGNGRRIGIDRDLDGVLDGDA